MILISILGYRNPFSKGIAKLWWCEFGEGNGTPLQYSCLENPMDGGAWKAVVHGVTEGQTRQSNFTYTFHFHALEKEMATHSSVFTWRIPGTVEPGGLPFMGSHRVGHDWSNLATAAAYPFLIIILFLKNCHIHYFWPYRVFLPFMYFLFLYKWSNSACNHYFIPQFFAQY